MRRLIQVLKYGSIHAKEIGRETNTAWIKVFFDIFHCFYKYRMWSNQYKQEKFYLLDEEERIKIGEQYKLAGIQRDLWQKSFIKNRKFIAKYSAIKYECGSRRAIRNAKYTKEFAAGKNLFVEYGVDICRGGWEA